MPILVSQEAPDFTTQAVFPDNTVKEINLKKHLNGKYGILFFYPLNFTFVCPTEILSFASRLKDFHERDAEVLAVSVDSPFSHLAYKNTKTVDGGIGNIQFPLVSDLSKKIATDYGVLNSEGTVAFRATFLIDKKGVVRHQIINDLSLGRSVDEALRMLDALTHYELHGEVCPANWRHGQEAMLPNQQGVASYLKKHASNL